MKKTNLRRRIICAAASLAGLVLIGSNKNLVDKVDTDLPSWTVEKHALGYMAGIHKGERTIGLSLNIGPGYVPQGFSFLEYTVDKQGRTVYQNYFNVEQKPFGF